MKSPAKRTIILVLVLALHVALDQGTKALAFEHLEPGKTVQVVGEVFVLKLVWNPGAFLGLGADSPEILKFLAFRLVPLVALVALAAWLTLGFAFRRTIRTGLAMSLTAVLGGGIGNLIDRFANGSLVLDFMNFGIGPLRTGILNVADMSITFGAIACVIFMILDMGHKKPQSPPATP